MRSMLWSSQSGRAASPRTRRLMLACGVGLAGQLAMAAPPGLHSPLERIDVKALVGYTLQTLDNGFTSYELLPKGRAVFRSTMGAEGKGTWTATKTGVRASGQATGGPCGEGEDCSKPWSWSVELTDLARSQSGLLVATEPSKRPKEQGVRHVFECDDDEKTCEVVEGLIVGVLPASEDRALYDAVAVSLQAVQGMVHAAGEPAKHPREVSEVWWVPRDADARDAAAEVARALAPVIGEVEPQKWTFGPSRYDVIVVAGKRRADPPPSASDLKK